jgi:Uma2 family endonuclease
MTISAEALKPRVRTPRKKTVDVPPYLVYETLGGVPVFYKGWQNVITGKQKLEEIMGYGDIQLYLVNLLKDYFQPIFGKEYWVWSGEAGLHIAHGSNPSLDFIIVPKSAFSLKNAKNKYINTPPKVVIEVDTKADTDTLSFSEDGYYMTKTQTLLDFGVSEVIWIYTQFKKVLVAKPNQPWLTVNWTDEIEIMGHSFTIQSMIDSFEPAHEQE